MNYTEVTKVIDRVGKKEWDWINQAIDSNSTGLINWPWQTGDKVGATNGYRLHLVEGIGEKLIENSPISETCLSQYCERESAYWGLNLKCKKVSYSKDLDLLKNLALIDGFKFLYLSVNQLGWVSVRKKSETYSFCFDLETEAGELWQHTGITWPISLCVNVQDLHDALNYKSSSSCIYLPKDKTKPLIVTHSIIGTPYRLKAIVMPLREDPSNFTLE